MQTTFVYFTSVVTTSKRLVIFELGDILVTRVCLSLSVCQIILKGEKSVATACGIWPSDCNKCSVGNTVAACNVMCVLHTLDSNQFSASIMCRNLPGCCQC